MFFGFRGWISVFRPLKVQTLSRGSENGQPSCVRTNSVFSPLLGLNGIGFTRGHIFSFVGVAKKQVEVLLGSWVQCWLAF